MNKTYNIVTILKDLFKLPDNMCLDLFNYQWSASPVMGKHEALFAMLFKTALLPKIGDVSIGGKLLEVKGSGARLKGQHGYGDSKLMRKSWENLIIDFAKYVGVSDYIISKGKGSNSWNLNKTNQDNCMLIYNLKNIINLTDKQKLSSTQLKYFITGLLNSYLTIYTEAESILKKYLDELMSSFDLMGEVDLLKFHTVLATISYEYYVYIERFEYLAIGNKNSGNFIITTSDVSQFNK